MLPWKSSQNAVKKMKKNHHKKYLNYEQFLAESGPKWKENLQNRDYKKVSRNHLAGGYMAP